MNVNDCSGRFYKTNYKKISEYILTVDSLHGGGMAYQKAENVTLHSQHAGIYFEIRTIWTNAAN